MTRVAQVVVGAILLTTVAMVLFALFGRTPEADPPMPGIVASVRAAGVWAHASLALGTACVAAAAAGAFATRPRALVRGLGHAAFAAGLAGAATGFREAMETAAQLGAAATPADAADSIDAALACLIVGAVAEAVALACAGALRLWAPPPRPLPT